MSKIKLIEIKIDEQGKKIGALLEVDSKEEVYELSYVLEQLRNGVVILNAAIENDELVYKSSGKKPIDLKNSTFTEWTAEEYLGNKKWKCRCSCGKYKAVSNFSLLYSKSTSCGHIRTAIEDLSGKSFGEWYVIDYAGNQMWNCECSCETRRQVRGDRLKQGLSKSCGHDTNKFVDLSDTQIGQWYVERYVGNGYWQCTCSCGTTKNVSGTSLKTRQSTSCGHNDTDLSQQTINEWYVIRKLNNRQYECMCACGKIRAVYTSNLMQGISTNCGQCKRTEEQIAIMSNKENFVALLLREYIRLNRQLLYSEVASLLNISHRYAIHLVNKYDAHAYINVLQNRSELEESIALYVESLGVNINRCDKQTIPGVELDIYIPEHRVAIEVNGSYWHSSLKKDKNYHIQKTLTCQKNNINLIHIFEHEWQDTKMCEKLKELIKKTLNIQQTIIYARNTTINIVDTHSANLFLDIYHLQGTLNHNEAYGLYYNNELVEIMTFGIPRYNYDCNVELLRLCTKTGYIVVGGASKLFKHYLALHPTSSIVSYCNLAKFTGDVYTNIGMTFEENTPPSYVYVNNSTLQVLSRYQCMKHKLIEKGWGTADQTEEQIMAEHGYLKVYDCGNKRYVYRPA